jgi:hypothetical protein
MIEYREVKVAVVLRFAAGTWRGVRRSRYDWFWRAFPFGVRHFNLRARVALSRIKAAFANGPAVLFFGAPLTSLPKFQPWTCPRFLIPNFLWA